MLSHTRVLFLCGNQKLFITVRINSTEASNPLAFLVVFLREDMDWNGLAEDRLSYR